MLTFDNPEFLFLLLLIIPGVWIRHAWRKRGGTISFAFTNWRGSRFVPPLTWQSALNALLSILFWLGFATLICALANPSETKRERVFLTRGIDMMIVLDCSPSMAAQDFGVQSRFEQARATIRDFINQRENDPIGLIAFGAEAELRVPPTLDYGSVKNSLDSLHIMDLGDGTAIGLGLALAGLHLQHSSAAEKIIILLTDGENNSGEIIPDVAANIIQGLGVRIYAIGVGSSGEFPLEYTDPTTGKLLRGTYKGTLNEGLLKSVAAKTSGQYFAASGPGTLQSVFQAIDSIEKVENRVRIDVYKNSLVNVFLVAGLIAILTDALLRRLVIRELV